MSNIKHVKGDLSDPSTFIENFDPRQTPIFLLHQVNCQGVMGGGVALSLANCYPTLFPEYANYCQKPTENLAGTALFTVVEQGILVINLFGQVTTGISRQTNYEYLYQALHSFFHYLPDYPEYIIAFPKNMSSGLAGGDWNIVYAMILSFVKDLPNTIYIVDYVNPNEVKNHAVNPS